MAGGPDRRRRSSRGATVSSGSMLGEARLAAAQLRAAGLALPLVAFVGVTFVAPLGTMFSRSVYDAVVADALPETLALLEGWDGESVPGEDVFAAAARELMRGAGGAGDRAGGPGGVNRVQGGMRSVVAGDGTSTCPRRPTAPGARPSSGSIRPGARWAPGTRCAPPASATPAVTTWPPSICGGSRTDPSRARRRTAASTCVCSRRTFLVSLSITGLCLLFGYPLAHFIAHAPPRRAGLFLALVLVPFWTSLLVRTTSWIVLLQGQGVINDILVALGLVSDDGRLALVYNMTGTFVAMTHVLLPFMVLPLYSVMRGIPRSHMDAAASLGAGPAQGFLRVYWPQTLPGSGAGSLLVFILAIGYYITPALVGGSTGQLISNMVAYHMQTSLNWGLASALGAIILACVIGLYLLYERLAGTEGVRVA